MITRVKLLNFKAWSDTGDIPFKPITGFFGTNSSGKTSIIQSLLLLKQTAESSDRGLTLHFGDNKAMTDLGDFKSLIYQHDDTKELDISIKWSEADPFVVRD